VWEWISEEAYLLEVMSRSSSEEHDEDDDRSESEFPEHILVS